MKDAHMNTDKNRKQAALYSYVYLQFLNQSLYPCGMFCVLTAIYKTL